MKRPTNFGATLAIAGSLLLSTGPGHAEDIQIYLEAAPDAGASNVLFLIENSGGTNRNFCSGGDKDCVTFSSDKAKTIEEIAFAMGLVADSLGANLRTGVASQHAGGSDGGAINYPVANLSEPGQTKVSARVGSETGDAYQLDGATAVDVISATLSLPGRPHPVNNTDAGDVAIVLNELMIPRWAAIKEASLSFRMPAGQAAGDKQSFAVSYQLTDSANDFSTTEDIFSRTWSKNYEVAVTAVDNTEGVYTLGGAELRKLVEDATARPEWCGRNNIALRFSKAGTTDNVPEIYSYRATGELGDRLGITQLDVEWDGTSDGVVRPDGLGKQESMSCMGGYQVGLAGFPDDAVEEVDAGTIEAGTSKLIAGKNSKPEVSGLRNNKDYLIGLRFANLGFGPDAIVSNAQLRLHVLEGGTARLRPLLGDTTSFATNAAISSAAAGTAQDLNLAKGDVSIDVTKQVQEVINSTGWSDVAALGMRIDSSADPRVVIHALDGGAGTPAANLLLSMASPSPKDFARTISRRDELKQVLTAMADGSGGGNNKLGSAYLEAGRYMLGLAPLFEIGRSHPESFLDPDSRSFYLSPVTETNECLPSHIIKISHSDPNGDNNAPKAINQVTGGSCGGDWECMEKLAAYLRDNEVNSIGSTIITHTVTFAGDSGGQSISAEMEAVAKAGGGMFRKANNAMELADAIRDLLDRITIKDASMAAPGVAVNQLNRFEHLDQLYYALFRPDFSSSWDGNLKRYRLDFSADPPVIVDENGLAAVDAATGFFKETSNSWWGLRADGTDDADGSDVEQGGAREELSFQAGGRRLFIPDETGAGLVLLEGVEGITPERLGLPADATKEEMQFRVDFLLGSWGDPLHSEPRLVNYGFEGDNFIDAISNADKQKNVVFVATNNGALHAVEALTGKELFTFMPEEELIKTEARYSPHKLNVDDPKRGSGYGLDGGMTTWRRAANDGSGDASAVYLYAAQRRGGRNLYALDVSDYNTTAMTPKMLWHIQGGSGDFERLGQTWAPPSLARIKLNGESVPVVVIAGGYSPDDHDVPGLVSGNDAMGNAIYIVHALTGKKIWSVSSTGTRDYTHADMSKAIPAAVSVVDADFDGIADYLYASDMGGQVFRVDLNHDNSGAADLVHQVATVASIGTEDTAYSGIANHRRFFASPVVALSKRDDKPLLQVVIGSGYRAYPLDMQTGDRIYVFDDTDALNARVADFTPSDAIREADLLDVTNDESPAASDFADKRGWLIRLVNDNGNNKGEKVLASAVVVDGVIFITSYLPETVFDNPCQRVVGSSRLYGLQLADGSPALRKKDGTVERSQDIVLPGLPPSPQLLTNSPDKLVVLVGTAAVDPGITIDTSPRRTRWYEVDDRAGADAVLNKAMFGDEAAPTTEQK